MQARWRCYSGLLVYAASCYSSLPWQTVLCAPASSELIPIHFSFCCVLSCMFSHACWGIYFCLSIGSLHNHRSHRQLFKCFVLLKVLFVPSCTLFPSSYNLVTIYYHDKTHLNVILGLGGSSALPAARWAIEGPSGSCGQQGWYKKHSASNMISDQLCVLTHS